MQLQWTKTIFCQYQSLIKVYAITDMQYSYPLYAKIPVENNWYQIAKFQKHPRFFLTYSCFKWHSKNYFILYGIDIQCIEWNTEWAVPVKDIVNDI